MKQTTTSMKIKKRLKIREEAKKPERDVVREVLDGDKGVTAAPNP